MKRICLALALLVTVACVAPFDMVTLENIQALQSKQIAEQRCAETLLHEELKAGMEKDSKTIRHIRELCECYASAANETQERACKANVEAYAVYEKNKGGGAP